MRLFHILTVIVATQLAGCTTVFISRLMDGPTPCPAQVANLTHQNINALQQLRVGFSKDLVRQLFQTAPERVHLLSLNNGEKIETYFYRVRQPNSCQYAERLAYNLEPVFFEDDRYIGQGYDFYNANILPHREKSKHVEVVAHRL